MIYEFLDVKTGAPVEVEMDWRDAPEIGSVLEVEGRRIRRVPSLPKVRVKPSRIVLYREALNDPDAPAHDADGFPAFEGLGGVREFYAKKAHKTGRVCRVDPDGGVGRDVFKQQSDERRKRVAARKGRIERQKQLMQQVARQVRAANTK